MGRVSHHLVVGLPGYPPPKTAAPLWGSPTRNSFREGAHQPLVLGAFVKMIPIFFRFMCTICINRIIYTDNIYKSLLHTYIYIYIHISIIFNWVYYTIRNRMYIIYQDLYVDMPEQNASFLLAPLRNQLSAEGLRKVRSPKVEGSQVVHGSFSVAKLEWYTLIWPLDSLLLLLLLLGCFGTWKGGKFLPYLISWKKMIVRGSILRGKWNNLALFFR